MTKISVCRAPYLGNHTSYDSHLWCKCVKWWYLQVFLSILKFWFSGLSGLKGQKIAQNDKFLSISPCISGTIYHMIFLYGTHVCMKELYLQAFFFFWKFWFSGSSGGGVKWQKMARNDKKFCLTPYLRKCIWVLVHMCKMMTSPANIFIFQNFDFEGS